MESPLETVTELQEALNELKSLETQLEGIPDWMQELHDEHSARQEEIEAIASQLDAAAAERRTAEAEISDHQQQLKTYQEQISLVRNQREYGALLHEIDLVKGQIQLCEERALAALEVQEESQQRLDSEREKFRDLDGRYADTQSKWNAEKPGLASQAETVRARVKELKGRLPAGVLALFSRILDRHHGQALAVARKTERAGKAPQTWHCEACNYHVRPQSVVQIADQGKIVFCDSCKRILILDRDSH